VTVAVNEREALLERHGRAYGELGLAVTFTDGSEGEAAKRVTRRGWNTTPRLADGAFGAALLAGRGLRRNPVVVLGASGLVGVDIDGKAGANLLRELHPDRLPRTVTVRTGKGHHLWFRRPADLRDVAKIELGPEGLEVSKDGYVVAPPARHPCGRIYAFVDGRAPWDLPLAVLTEQHVRPFLAHARRSRSEAIVSTGPILEGGRHRHLRRIAGAMRRVGACEESILAALLVENVQRCAPPQDEPLVRALAHDIATRYQPEAGA
jgi:hypothetical protein